MDAEKKLWFGLVLLLMWVPALMADTSSPSLELAFFGSATCGECLEIKETVLKPFVKEHAALVNLAVYDTEDSAAFARLVIMEKAYGVTQPLPQELFFPDTVLLGYESIMRDGPRMLAAYVAAPDRWKPLRTAPDTLSYQQKLSQRFQKFTFLSILAAGLIDGVNPCAIATMIFLISFLTVQKRRKSEVLAVGLCFTAAVFFTYLLLGVGAFKALTAFKHYSLLTQIIKWVSVGGALIIAAISFRDAIVYARTKNAKEVKLQLAKPLKLQIHKIIARNLSGRKLIVGAMVTGFLVTLLEAVCTGQVYLPTIVLMTRSDSFGMQGWLYLLFYNFLFVLPLLLVMILAYFGLTWEKLSKTMQQRLPLMKTLMGAILVALAVFLAVAG